MFLVLALDHLRKDFRSQDARRISHRRNRPVSEIVRFRARRRKNYEAYTVYMLNNFFKVVGQTRGVPVLAGRPVSPVCVRSRTGREIWKL